MFFNQKTTNWFGIYNIWQPNTHILNIIIFIEIIVFFPCWFFLNPPPPLLSEPFFGVLCVFLHLLEVLLYLEKIPNFITYFSRILCKNWIHNNDCILFPELIILCLRQYSQISPNQIMNGNRNLLHSLIYFTHTFSTTSFIFSSSICFGCFICLNITKYTTEIIISTNWLSSSLSFFYFFNSSFNCFF